VHTQAGEAGGTTAAGTWADEFGASAAGAAQSTEAEWEELYARGATVRLVGRLNVHHRTMMMHEAPRPAAAAAQCNACV
jgi:hypothetical protein